MAEIATSSLKRGEQGPTLVLTTRKDLVKLHLAQIAGIDLLAIEIEIAFLSGEESIRELLLQYSRPTH